MPSSKATTSSKKKNNNSKGKVPQKKKTGRISASRVNEEKTRQRNQVIAVILFACAVFLAALVLIPGVNVWNWAHRAILGIFGGWALLWAALMIYVAVVTTLEKPHTSLSGKIWLTVVIIVLCCTAGFVFSGKLPETGTKFFDFISSLYKENVGIGGGVVGGILGLPLLKAMGNTGAKIIIILLIFVFVMILTGTTLIGLFRTIKRPVDAVSTSVRNARERREEERALSEQTNIDVPIKREAPADPVNFENTSDLFPKYEPKKKSKGKNEKLDRLEKAFGLENSSPDSDQKPVSADKSCHEIEKNESSSDLPKEIATNDNQLSEGKAAKTLDASKDGGDSPRDLPLNVKDFGGENLEVGQFQHFGPENPSETYIFPPVTLLKRSARENPAQELEELKNNGENLVEILNSFGVQTRVLDISRGPAVTRYEIQPAAGVKISRITNLADDLALNLAATAVRIEAPIPGKAAVGIEVPNKTRSMVRMRDLIESNAFQASKSKISVVLGKDITGGPVIADLSKMPHLLIAGTTGSGKSVCINSLIVSMLYKASPDEVRFLMIDPKAVELTEYNGMPHMLVPVVTEPKKASGALSWAVSEMMNRYRIFNECNVRNLNAYNTLAETMEYQDENGQPLPAMPQIVIIIDELADLMMAAPKEVEDSICRLAQLARAAGMHLVVATQRPSVDVVTGLIKANIPSRIALTVSNAIDSRTILDAGGAEKLLGNGDMLFAPVDANKPIRVQGCYVSDEEISAVVNFVKKNKAIDYDENVIEEIEKNAASTGEKDDEGKDDGESDPMMDEAIKCVVEAGQASTSLLQRRLRLGYARAGRLIDEMEQLGIVGPHEGSKPRQVLMTYNQWLERNMQKPDNTKDESQQ